MEKSELVLPGTDAMISEIPNLLGFVPAESLVLIGFADLGTRSAMRFTLRIDLPDPEHRSPAARYLLGFAETRQIDAALAVIVGGSRSEQRELVNELRSEFDKHEITVHAIWTAALHTGESWYCYQDSGCRGSVYDTSESQLAAMATVEGFRRWGSREEMVASIAPVPDEDRQVLADGVRAWRALPESAPGSLREATAPVFAALEQLRGGEALSTDQAVAALGALGYPLVRDLMLARREPGAEQLWTILLRHAPDAEVEAPAVLLATAAHLNGDGVLARIALDRALEAVAPQPPSNVVRMLEEILVREPAHLREILDDVAGDPDLRLD
ncbi:hypothetical protein GCM10027271_46260 [Saccharopolyspora gloriosae]|uniref:DUF4192 domain-containing protein n=1 Tax=Saccharopolyspora gloriosae TaxID=455344 RepID=A0A840NEP0_9PSEU|nr:DUF4192 domain-containing protein [Saccharopolyspora gloriosae]MBB5070074.1 hypothetical protein [Saccharopolyspora gloriosae]